MQLSAFYAVRLDVFLDQNMIAKHETLKNQITEAEQRENVVTQAG
jgi:hypothetical protein